MICCNIRQSGMNNYLYCQHQFFINNNLGYENKPRLKTTKGSVTHLVLELCAKIKKQFQETSKKYIVLEHECLNTPLKVSKEDFLLPKRLTNDEVDAINKTRINKDTYMYDVFLKHGHIRYGVEIVEQLIKSAYDFYVKNTDHDWKPVDFKDVTNFSWIVLDNEKYDPRRRNILDSEVAFDYTMEQDWAKYKLSIGNESFSGNLKIFGTIDLITKIDDETIEICDYKTGTFYDWAKSERKSYTKLQNDIQLILYYYVARRMYPQYKHCIVSIYYIRDTGVHTIFFDDSTIDRAERMIKVFFEKISQNNKPKMLDEKQEDFRCVRLCDYYKNKVPSGENLCRFIYNEIDRIGIDSVVEKYKDSNLNMLEYKSPRL